MVSPEFLSRLGLFVIKNFLDPEICEALIAASHIGEGKQATITTGNQDVYDENARKTFQVALPKELENDVYSRLIAIRPDLEAHFQTKLEDCRAPLLLCYGVGDFFQRHYDTYEDPTLPEAIQKRKVSVSIMLNECKEEDVPNTYSGGALTFYNLMSDPRLKMRGFPLQPEPGLLIAFSSRLVHEVQPVLRGKRYSIVTWFL
jgi:predicted 2-oxoglutarate/Fe(II)-dependent dioxygenase YbiX